MKTKKYLHSFVKSCILYFVTYSLIALGLMLLFNYFVGSMLNNAFPTIDNVFQYNQALKEDAFANIPYRKFKNCDFIILDKNNSIVFATNSNLYESLNNIDTNFIEDYYSDEFYQIAQITDENDKLYYQISYNTTDYKTGENKIIQDCIVDANYNIIQGNLFPDKKKLTKQQVALMQGKYIAPNTMKDIAKYTYNTNNGDARTLLFISPQFNSEDYRKIIRSTYPFWIVLIFILLLVIMVQSILFSRKIKKAIRPLDTAILSYQNGSHDKYLEEKVPYEFKPIVTHFKHLLAQLDQAQIEKQQEEQQRYQMIANISHDLNTPLTTIQGYSKAFCDDMVIPKKKKLYMETIYRKSQVCSELINTLFEYTKLEHPHYELNVTPMDLSEYVREYLSERYTEFEIRNFQLEINLPETSIMCNIDTKMLRRALDNLTENALKYNHNPTTIFYTLVNDKEFAYLTIADNGVGIAPNIRQTVFEPFVTSNSARTSGDGTGIGMSITKKIIELHGGSISLIDPPHSGFSTEFQIILPKTK